MDLHTSDVAGQGFLNISYAIIYIFSRSLGEHLDRAVCEVADVAGQPVATGHPVGREAKAHALNAADEDYVPCNHKRLTIDYCFERQVDNILVDVYVSHKQTIGQFRLHGLLKVGYNPVYLRF